MAHLGLSELGWNVTQEVTYFSKEKVIDHLKHTALNICYMLTLIGIVTSAKIQNYDCGHRSQVDTRGLFELSLW